MSGDRFRKGHEPNTGDWANGCRGKRRYTSKRQAGGRLRTMVRDGRSAATLNAYKCRNCGGWHLGNTWTPRVAE